MPIYAYSCPKCGASEEAYRKIAQRKRSPQHSCGKMVLELRPTAISAFTPYRAIGGDRRLVKNQGEHRAFLREFNYEEVGNDASMAPPHLDVSDAEWERDRQRKVADLERSVCEQADIVEKVAGSP